MCVAGSLDVAFAIAVAIAVAVVDGPLWLLEVKLGLDVVLEDSGICRAILPHVSRLAASDAKLFVKSSLLLRGEVVHPVHLHGKEFHVTEVTVSRDFLFRRKA